MRRDEVWDHLSEPDANGCRHWLEGADDGGYGRIWVGRADRPHRVAWEEANGPIPEGMTVEHKCHTDDPTCFGGRSCQHRTCCEPSHLELLSGVDNSRRGHHPGPLKMECPNGHPYDEANTRITPKGYRRCRTCHREAEREARRWAA